MAWDRIVECGGGKANLQLACLFFRKNRELAGRWRGGQSRILFCLFSRAKKRELGLDGMGEGSGGGATLQRACLFFQTKIRKREWEWWVKKGRRGKTDV